MKINQKNLKLYLLLFVFFVTAFLNDLRAQNITTYYSFPSDVMDVRGLSIDTTGNFYFYSYDQNWNGRFGKISSEGTFSTIASGPYYHPERIIADNDGNIYFTDMGGMSGGIKKITPDGIVSDFYSTYSYKIIIRRELLKLRLMELSLLILLTPIHIQYR